jgi:hypothetical protein
VTADGKTWDLGYLTLQEIEVLTDALEAYAAKEDEEKKVRLREAAANPNQPSLGIREPIVGGGDGSLAR